MVRHLDLLRTVLSELCVHDAGLLRLDEQEYNGVSVISHSEHLKAQLEAVLMQGNSSDVSLHVETTDGDEVKVIQAHTLMLSLQSRTFQKLLEKRNGSTLVLRESPECITVFEKFIRWGKFCMTWN